jgi:streptogramin lyase
MSMRVTETLNRSVAIACLLFATSSGAQAQSAVALSGQVSSAAERAMEGVVVSAKKNGSTISLSVVTDATGQFAFPADRLAPGRYALTARAAGYQFEPRVAEVSQGAGAKADLKLSKVEDLSPVLTNAEWLTSMRGGSEQKKFLLNCVGCHTLERIAKSKYDADGFLDVMARMSGYYPGSTPAHPQRLAGNFQRLRDRGVDSRGIAEWLASNNLSRTGKLDYELTTLPRLTGKSTRVIITEYDLPDPRIQPHDVVLDREGSVWYSDFGQMFLGKMDPKTGKVTQYPIPEQKADYPKGTLDLEIDKDDNPWIGISYQAAIGKFDKKTEKFTIFNIPKDWDSEGAQLSHIAVRGIPADGKVWMKNSDGNKIYRLDVASGTFENLGSFQDPRNGKRIGTYGLHSDDANNIYLLDFSADNIARIDAATKKFSVYVTPTKDSRPRRGRVDAEGKLWFAEYQGDAIGMFDPKNEKFTEWKIKTPWSAPYDAIVSKDGHAWTGSMLTDRVARVNVQTGEVTEYQLPRPTNIRRVYVDDAQLTAPLWVGSNHGGSIVKVEPLE